jgi:membrane protease YdiL (CAAX protease family)
MSGFEIADLLLLSGGAVWLLTVMTRHARRKSWASLLRLTAAPANTFTLTELLLAAMMFLFLPSVVAGLVKPWLAEANAAPASTQPGQDSIAPLAVGLTIGHGLAIVVLLAIGRQRVPGGWSAWGLSTHRIGRELFQAARLYVMTSPVIFVVFKATRFAMEYFGVESTQHAAIELLRQPDTPIWLWTLTLFNAFAIAAIVEELFFRGLIQSALSRGRGGAWPAVIVTSAVFGFIHYPYLDTIPPLVVFGVILGWQYARSGSLTRVILFHAIFNGKTLLYLALGAPVE